VPDVDAILVPVGGGGLIAGLALAVKSLCPNVKVYVIHSACILCYICVLFVYLFSFFLKYFAVIISEQNFLDECFCCVLSTSLTHFVSVLLTAFLRINFYCRFQYLS